MKLYAPARSSACHRVRIALNLKGVAFENVPVHLTREGGEQRRPDYLARNPQGLVPSLELDDGTVLTQSLAIIEYLEAVRPEPRLIPADPVRAARVRAVAFAVACDIHPLNNLRVLRYLKDPLGHAEADADAWTAHWIRAGGLDAVEAMLGEGPFSFGDAPTLADVVLVPQVYNARRSDVPIGHLSRILAIDALCAGIPAFAAAHPDRQN